jgi:putative transposase
MNSAHRKRVRHFDDVGGCRELTFSCYDRRPLLTHDERREQLARAIDRACENHGWRLTAFVFMPEHVHLLVYPAVGTPKAADLLFAIKRPFSYRIKIQLRDERSPLLQQLTVRQRPGVQAFRFWQEGPGYDRNLVSDRAIVAAIDYIHLNPVRRGLCRSTVDWKWSSARWYASDGRDVDADLPRLTPLPAGFFVS